VTDAYLAGIIDGEGYVTIQHRIERDKYYAFRSVVVIGTKNWPLMLAIHKAYGGSFCVERKRGLVRVRWCGAKVIPILEAVLPHLIVKRGLAELVLEFERLRLDKASTLARSWGQPHTEEYRQRALAFVGIAKRLLKEQYDAPPEGLNSVYAKEVAA